MADAVRPFITERDRKLVEQAKAEKVPLVPTGRKTSHPRSDGSRTYGAQYLITFRDGRRVNVWMSSEEHHAYILSLSVVAPESPFCGYCGNEEHPTHSISDPSEAVCCSACASGQGKRFPKQEVANG